LQKRGDWAWFTHVLNITGWRGEGPTKRICWKCNATVDDYRDPSIDATWRGTMIQTHLHIRQLLAVGAFTSILFQWPGFAVLGLDLIQADLMHTGDLGVIQYLLGNVLFELFQEMGGIIGNPTAVLDDLQVFIRQAAKKLKMDQPPVNDLTMGMVKVTAKAPRFKGKAAESRHMLKCVRQVLETYMTPKNDYQRMRLHCVQHLDDFYQELIDWVPGISNARCATLARRHLTLYAELGQVHLAANDWQDKGWFKYRWYPKHHLFIHIVEDQIATCDNPREHWCYGDEDFIGDMVDVAETVGPTVLHRSVMQKYRI